MYKVERIMQEPFSSCYSKQEDVKKLFAHCKTLEGVYQKLIELGRLLSPFPEEYKVKENLVRGCQSQLYIVSSLEKSGLMRFQAHSDALISAGLAYLLLAVYNEETPECLLKCPPSFLNELNIPNALSPSRSNGLASLHLRMKQEALKFLLSKHSVLECY